MSNKIETIRIRNFKGIDRIESNLHESNVFVVGGNGKGKTSFIDAIWNTLTGKNIPPEPIKKGENESTIEVELKDHVAILEFKRDKKEKVKSTFKLIAKADGELIAQPRTVLNQMIGVIDFNPNHFFELSANKQIEYFCSLIGLDFNDVDRKIAELFEERSFRNKELKRLKDNVNVWFDETIASKDPVNLKFLFERQIEDNKKRENVLKVTAGIEDRHKRIGAIRVEIEKLMNESKAVQLEIEKANVWLDVPENQPMSDMDAQTIQSQIDTAETENQLIETHKSAKVNAAALVKVENDIRDIEKEMDDAKESKREKLSKAIDIPNLSFDGDRFLFGGLPFENTQINTANQLIAGLRIGLKMMKDVRILKFDGSLIDDNNMKAINDWSKDNDVQLFVEVVDRTGGKLEIRVEENS